jgi:hypothetical protein
MIPTRQFVRFHPRLNPRLWLHYKLRVEVRLKLLQVAIAFYRFLDIPRLRVSDIVMTGSNAAYNYTSLSDIDIHLIVNFARTSCPALSSNIFTTKKALWNQTYDIVIRDQPVELYVEDTAEPVTANGVYSILHNMWLKRPVATPPKWDDTAVTAKAEAYADEIDALLTGDPQIATINDMLNRLYGLRQNGLMAGGEFSTENMAFKVLRNSGYLDRLRHTRVAAITSNLSY